MGVSNRGHAADRPTDNFLHIQSERWISIAQRFSCLHLVCPSLWTIVKQNPQDGTIPILRCAERAEGIHAGELEASMAAVSVSTWPGRLPVQFSSRQSFLQSCCCKPLSALIRHSQTKKILGQCHPCLFWMDQGRSRLVQPVFSQTTRGATGGQGLIVEDEAERLRLDAQARDAMAQLANTQSEDAPGAWKWEIRKRVWDLLEAENLARDPRPVHHRIPNFVGANGAAAKLASLPLFQAAQCVKVNPDTPQKQVRLLTLNAGKKLLTPQPRLRTGFFSVLEAASVPSVQDACNSAGVAKYGTPVGLDEKFKVDLLVIGSVAVDPTTGARLGKGEGFAELEYGLLRWMGAVDDSTCVVTTVHDKQLVNDIPVEKLLIHDVPVDIICTPTQIIHTNTSIPKPQGIYWDKLSPQKLEQIRILRDLKRRIEKETGKRLPSGPSETLPPLAARNRPGKGQNNPRQPTTTSGQTLFMWNIPSTTTWRQVQDHVVELGGAVTKVSLFRKSGNPTQMGVVSLQEGANLAKLVEDVDKSMLQGATVRAKIDGAPDVTTT